MIKRLVITGQVGHSIDSFQLGLYIERYGCRGLGHHGIEFALEFGFVEFILCVGVRYNEE